MVIQIGRTVYEVKSTKDFKNSVRIGRIDYNHKTITVARRVGFSKRRLNVVERKQILFHEVVHGILHDMRHPLDSNEKFVDEFAKRLRLLKWSNSDNSLEQHEINLVPQRTERLRKLRKKIPRSSRT
jgi:hypothetical protein